VSKEPSTAQRRDNTAKTLAAIDRYVDKRQLSKTDGEQQAQEVRAAAARIARGKAK